MVYELGCVGAFRFRLGLSTSLIAIGACLFFAVVLFLDLVSKLDEFLLLRIGRAFEAGNGHEWGDGGV